MHRSPANETGDERTGGAIDADDDALRSRLGAQELHGSRRETRAPRIPKPLPAAENYGERQHAELVDEAELHERLGECAAAMHLQLTTGSAFGREVPLDRG